MYHNLIPMLNLRLLNAIALILVRVVALVDCLLGLRIRSQQSRCQTSNSQPIMTNDKRTMAQWEPCSIAAPDAISSPSAIIERFALQHHLFEHQQHNSGCGMIGH
jgi:hypothetical protein